MLNLCHDWQSGVSLHMYIIVLPEGRQVYLLHFGFVLSTGLRAPVYMKDSYMHLQKWVHWNVYVHDYTLCRATCTCVCVGWLHVHCRCVQEWRVKPPATFCEYSKCLHMSTLKVIHSPNPPPLPILPPSLTSFLPSSSITSPPDSQVCHKHGYINTNVPCCPWCMPYSVIVVTVYYVHSTTYIHVHVHITCIA